MTTSALTGGFAVCQARLGAKVHDPKDPGADLGPMFRQVVGTILRLAATHPEHWLPIHGSHDVPAYGFERIIDPPPLEVNTLRLLTEFHAGSLTLADTWRSMFAPANADDGPRPRREDAGKLVDAGPDPARDRRATGSRRRATTAEMAEALSAFHFPDDLWARLIYDLVDRGPLERAADRAARRRARPDLLRAGRQLRDREPRTGRPTQAEEQRRAPGPRVRAPQAVPRRALGGVDPRHERLRRRLGPRARQRGRGRARSMTGARGPLPARILIPVANPATAEELIRLGAALLDPRAGELTALGIVEVPEGMPLSEGATRARHARRLLQRVLDFAPDGTPIHPIVRIGRHAAEGIIEASAEQEADLIIFGWGGKAPAGREGGSVISPTIDEVVRDAPSDIAVVKQRGSKEIRRIVVPVRGGPHAELALRYADAIAEPHRRDGQRPPLRPARHHPRRPGPGRARPGRSSSGST